MDDSTKKRYDLAVHFLEKEFGVSIVAFKGKKERDEALDNIRLGRSLKEAVMDCPANGLPI